VPAGGAEVSLFRNRLYDQRTGRWTQEDPLGVAGGLNLYQFNGNNPVMLTDPFGLSPCSDLRDEIDAAANDLEGYVDRYMEHYEKGDADAGHLRQVESRRNRYDKKVKAYRHMNCDDKEKNDHDDWMNGAGGAGVRIRWGSQLLPAPQSGKSNHGWTPRFQAQAPSITPEQVTAVGELGVAAIVLRVLILFGAAL
jgi:uncharacterized protein RhaS with RHS repeats